MINFSIGPMDIDSLLNQYTKDSIENKIINTMNVSTHKYNYKTIEYLKFELSYRVNIIKSSEELNKSKISFKIFKKSICNPAFWDRTEEGGFLLKENVSPSAAIKDIYANSHLYGTECSTAILIVFYKALLGVYPEELFDKLFGGLHLMDWHYIDADLDLNTYENEQDYFPGDCRYFANPDFNPETPQWQGENTIDLGNGKYYGHGLGIGTAEEIIKALNKLRKQGATKTAVLLETATRPNFKYLAYRYLNYIEDHQRY